MYKCYQGNISDGAESFSLFYIVSPPLILVTSIVFAVTGGVAWVYRAALILYLVLNIATFPIRKKGCGLCVLRNICFGSAVK